MDVLGLLYNELRYVNIALASDRQIPIEKDVLGFLLLSKRAQTFILS